MGAHRGVLVTDPALAGSDALARRRRSSPRRSGSSSSTSCSRASIRPMGSAASSAPRSRRCSSCRTCRRRRRSSRIRTPGTVRVRRISPTGFDVLEAPMPALIVGTQLLGEPRYPSLKGIMAARSKEVVTKSLADLGLDAASGWRRRAAATKVTGTAEAAGARRDAGRARHARGGREGDRRPPRVAEAHLMARRDLGHRRDRTPDGSLAKSSTEVATLARTLAEAAGGDAAGLVVAADPEAAARSSRATCRASSRSPSRLPTATPGRRSPRSGQRRFSPPSRPPRS